MSEKKDELTLLKEKIKAEKKAVHQINKDERRFSEFEDTFLETDRTLLTEEEIAPTTQINVDEIEDLDSFIEATGKSKKFLNRLKKKK